MKKAMIVGTLTLLLGGALVGCTADSNRAKSPTEDQTSIELPWIATKNTTKINSSDPVEAAVLVSRTLWTAENDNSRPASVVLTDVSSWQIAAVSTDLIHHPSNGPVLFINKDGIPAATLNELQRLAPKGAEGNNGIQVVIVGPVAAAVDEQLKARKLKVDHIEASDPAAVARDIDAYYAKAAGSLPQAVIVGSMDNPEYTLPAVNWIAHMPEPLLYVTKNEIPVPTADALKLRSGKASIYLLGPESIISKKVEDELKAYGNVTRISGKDPFENAIAFAKYKDTNTQFGWGITTPGHNLSFTTKDSTMLAIAAAPFSHLGKHAPLIYTNTNGMPNSVMDYVMMLQPKFQLSPAEGPYNHAWLTGNHATITSKAQSEIDDMLEISPAAGGDPHKGH